MNHLELIVKDGMVTIPSIFMFDYYDEVVAFVDAAREQNCVVVFENEEFTIAPDDRDSDVRFKLLSYASIILNHKIGNAYVRYLASPHKMGWDKVK